MKHEEASILKPYREEPYSVNLEITDAKSLGPSIIHALLVGVCLKTLFPVCRNSNIY